MTTTVIYSSLSKDTVVSGTPEKPEMVPLESDEVHRTFLIDTGKSALIVDSMASGGGQCKNRLFVLNSEKSVFIPEEERIYLPFVKKIQFEGSGNKEQK